VHERGGEVEAPAHPTGEVAQQSVARVDEVEPFEQLLDTTGENLLRHLRQPADEAQVLARSDVLVDRGVLAREPDRRAYLLAVLGHVAPEHERAPAIGLDQRGEDADGGGLAGAVRAQDAEHRAGGNVERDALQGFDGAEALAEILGDDGQLVRATALVTAPFATWGVVSFTKPSCPNT
jgi:hypothetical protein